MTDKTPPKPKKPVLDRARMEYLSFAAQIVSAIAIVVSLVFVGIQLRNGNVVTLRNESNATMSQWSAFRSSIYADRDTARVLQDGMYAESRLDEIDRLRFLYLLREHAWATFQVWDRAERGLVPTANFNSGAGPDFLVILCTPGGAAAWQTIRNELPLPFVTDLEALPLRSKKPDEVCALGRQDTDQL